MQTEARWKQIRKSGPWAFRYSAILGLGVFLLDCVSAQLGIFNRAGAAALLLAGIAFGAITLLHFGASAARALLRAPGNRSERQIAIGIYAGMAALICGFLWFYYTPSEHIIGVCDEGYYTATAINLAKTGGYELHAPLLAEVTEAEKAVLLKSEPAAAQRGTKLRQVHVRYQPGLFLRDGGSTGLTPQFPLGWPTGLASAYAIGGWKAFHAVNPALTIICAGLTGLLTLAWIGPVAALSAFVLFLFFPLDVWAARSIFSEPALQLAWLLLIAGWRESKRAPLSGGIITGLAAGALLYIKIEATFVVAGLIGLCAWHWADRRRFVLACAGSSLVALGLAGSAWRQFNQFYLADTFGTLSSKALWSAAVVAAAFAWGVSRPELRTFLARRRREKRLLRHAAFWLLLGLAFYGAVLRPDPATPDTYYYWPAQTEIKSYREESFLRLGWYWQPWGLAIAVVGSAALVRTLRKPWQVGLFGIGLMFLIGLSYDIRNNPLQPYAMRRYLPFAMPILIVGAAGFGRRAVVFLTKKANRKAWMPLGMQAAVTLVLLAGFIPINSVINRHIEFGGTQNALAAMAEKLPPRALVLVSETSPLSLLATPLQFVFGRECLIVPQPLFINAGFPSLVERWEAKGYRVYLLTEKGAVGWLAHGKAETLTATGYGTLETSYLFQTADKRPTLVLPSKLLYHLIPLQE